MRIKTNLIGNRVHIADGESTFDVLSGNPYDYSLVGRTIQKFGWLCVSE